MNSYKHFILKLLAVMFVFLAGLFYFNYGIDPHNRYHFNAAKADLKILSDSRDKVLTVPGNYDDRLLLKRFIETAPQPDAVVIGGSRVMNLQLPEFPRFLNAGVTSGTLKDYIAVWQIMKQNEKIPKTLFLAVDPPGLNSAAQNDRWLSFSEYYRSFFKTGLSGRDFTASLTSQLKDLLSFRTLIESFQKKEPGNSAAALLPASLYDGKSAARSFSFAMIYPYDYEQKTAQEVEVLAEAIGQGEKKAFRNWNCKELKYFDELSSLIADMKQQGVRVMLILMPYHALSLQIIQADPLARENLLFFRGKLEEISRRQEIPWYDGFRDTEAGLFETADFSDGVHLKTVPNQRFFRRILETLR